LKPELQTPPRREGGSLVEELRAAWLYAVIAVELVVIASTSGWILAGLILPDREVRSIERSVPGRPQ
jgi:hypothetical protein